MNQRRIDAERATNLWSSFQRAVDPLARGARIVPTPDIQFEEIGGLASPKEEILTYAYAHTRPEVYGRWGTFPPSALLMIGRPGSGKSLLAEALAVQTQMAFVRVDVPRIVLDVIHGAGKVGELIQGWSRTLEELPPTTIFFDELEFTQAHDTGRRAAELPTGPIMDLLLELIDRALAVEHCLVVGSTSYPDGLPHAFLSPGRFERVVEVNPTFPQDVIQALQIHASKAEGRAQRTLFEKMDWAGVVGSISDPSIGDWVRMLHAVLRGKARCDAAGEVPQPVSNEDFAREVSRFRQARTRIHTDGGNYV
ncbi:MAG: AAA family ATPase [Spirochaetaceae bacterium]|nr:AAA family ATPase [Myxococcales bacterium]MCB9726181.1 AAA family ATPase [Spirochaetaceae bacterium]